MFLRSKFVDELAEDQLEDGTTVFLFDVSVFVYLPFDNEIFYFSGFCSWYLFFLHKGIFFFTAEYINWKTMFLLQRHEKIIKKYSYCKIILRLFAYCLIISSFVYWSSRSNNSLSKIYFVFLLSRFLSCIWLFWSGLNKLSRKNIWNNPHVTWI